MKPCFFTHSLQCCLGRILTLFLIGLCLAANAQAELVDKVVAVVNDEVITLSEVEEEASRIAQVMEKDSTRLPSAHSMDAARETALNGLIDRRLIHQRAKLTNTSVSDEELAVAFENTRNRMAADPVEFKLKLAGSGMTEEFLKKQLRDQILQSKLVSYDVRAKTVVTDEMIRDFYDQQYTSKAEKGSFYLLQIGFQWRQSDSDSGEKEETKKRTQRARDLVIKGQDFKEVAKKYSELPSASDGGDLGVLLLDDMAAAMRTAIANLKPGEVSEIIETSDGYQFFKLLSAKDEAATASSSYEKVKEEIKEKLYDEKLKAAYSDWVKKLKESAYIQKL